MTLWDSLGLRGRVAVRNFSKKLKIDEFVGLFINPLKSTTYNQNHKTKVTESYSFIEKEDVKFDPM